MRGVLFILRELLLYRIFDLGGFCLDGLHLGRLGGGVLDRGYEVVRDRGGRVGADRCSRRRSFRAEDSCCFGCVRASGCGVRAAQRVMVAAAPMIVVMPIAIPAPANAHFILVRALSTVSA